MMAGFAAASHLAGLLIAITGLNFMTAATWAVLYTFTPESFPTAVRATAFGICSFLARLGGIAAPWLAGTLLEQGGPGVTAGFSVVCFLMAAAVLTIVPIETAGRGL